MLINSLTYIPASEEKGQTGLGRPNPAKTINAVPHSSQSKRKSDVSFPFSRGSCSIRSRKRLSRNEVTVCSFGFPVPWSQDWMESFTQSFQLSDAGENNRGSKPASVSNVTKVSTDGQKVDLWSQIYFLWYFSFSFSPTHFCTHIFSHREVRGQGHTLLADLALHESRSAAVQQLSRLSVRTWVPRKHLHSLFLNNSFLHYVLPQYPVSTKNTLDEGSWMLYTCSFIVTFRTQSRCWSLDLMVRMECCFNYRYTGLYSVVYHSFMQHCQENYSSPKHKLNPTKLVSIYFQKQQQAEWEVKLFKCFISEPI